MQLYYINIDFRVKFGYRACEGALEESSKVPAEKGFQGPPRIKETQYESCLKLELARATPSIEAPGRSPKGPRRAPRFRESSLYGFSILRVRLSKTLELFEAL